MQDEDIQDIHLVWLMSEPVFDIQANKEGVLKNEGMERARGYLRMDK